MPRPVARVLQEFQAAAVTSIEPTMKVVIVGPHVYAVDYPADRASIATTEYIGEDIEALMDASTVSPTMSTFDITAYPSTPLGAVPIDSSVKVFIEGYIEVATATDVTGSYKQNTLTTTAGDFSKAVIGDRVVIATDGVQVFEDLNQDFIAQGIDPGVDLLKIGADLHNIEAVLSEHRLLVKKTVTGAATLGLFAAADPTANIAYSIGDNAATYDNEIAAGATGQRVAWREVKLFKDASLDFVTKGVQAGHYLKIGADVHKIDSVLDKNHLLVLGGNTAAVSPATRGEFKAADGSANIAYSIGTQNGAFKDIIDTGPTGNGQRLASTSVVRTIYSVNSDKIVTLSQFLPFDAASAYNVRIEHHVDSNVVPTGADGWEVAGVTVNPTTKAITIPQNATVTYLAASRKIIDAQPYVEYQALRQDKTAEIKEVTATTLDTELGTDRKENKLRRAAGIAVANAGSAKIHYLALKTDDSTGHSTAQAICARDKQIFALVVLSQTVSILTSWKTHVNSMSEPKRGKRRVLLCQPGTLPSTKTVTSAKTDGTAESATTLFSPTADFSADLVVPGDKVVLTAPTTNEYTVASVLSGNRLTVSGAGFTGPEQAAAGAVAFSIVRTLDRAGQREELKSIAKGFNDRRVVACWPDKVRIGTDTSEPGYYLAAALGGMTAAFPAQQPMAKIAIAGIDELYNANTYFIDDGVTDEMEELMDAGWFTFEQETPQSAPYASQQHTTVGGTADPEHKYFSAVRNFDYVANRFQSIVDQYPAQWNVIDELPASVNQSIENEADLLMEDKRQKIGAPLRGISDLRTEPSETQSDKVETFLKVKIPKVLNALDLHLISA